MRHTSSKRAIFALAAIAGLLLVVRLCLGLGGRVSHGLSLATPLAACVSLKVWRPGADLFRGSETLADRRSCCGPQVTRYFWQPCQAYEPRSSSKMCLALEYVF